MFLPEVVDSDVCNRHHQDERQTENIGEESEGVVEREADAPAVVPEGDADICQEILQVVEKDLLPPHAHRVAEHVLGVDERHDCQTGGDEVVDEHQKDGQPGLAEPFGGLTLTYRDNYCKS